MSADAGDQEVYFTVRWRPSYCILHTEPFSAGCSYQVLDFHTPTPPPLLAAATVGKQFRRAEPGGW